MPIPAGVAVCTELAQQGEEIGARMCFRVVTGKTFYFVTDRLKPDVG